MTRGDQARRIVAGMTGTTIDDDYARGVVVYCSTNGTWRITITTEDP